MHHIWQIECPNVIRPSLRVPLLRGTRATTLSQNPFGFAAVTLAHINVTKNTMKVFMVVALVKFLDQLLASVQAANLSTE